MKTIIKYSIDILIPAISAYLASKDNIFIWLAEKGVLDSKFDLNLYQNIFLLINILFTTLYINLKLIVSERKEIQNKKEIEGLYNVIKEFVGNNLSNVCGSDNLVFNIRIFVPEICVWERVKSLLSGNKKTNY